jgi:hypothetical protein
MGQPIDVSARTIDDVTVFDTDRSITGQDGASFASAEEAGARSGWFPADLASRVFAADSAVDHVFVASNQVVVRRRGGWGDDDRDRVSSIVRGFFLHYPGD